MKKIFLYSITIGAFLLSGCGGQPVESPAPTSTEPPAVEEATRTATDIPQDTLEPEVMEPTATATEVPSTPTATPPPPTPVTLILDPLTISSISIYATFGQGEAPRDLAFSPDGTVLASAGGNTEDFHIRLWEVESGNLLATLEGHTGIVWGLAFSPDGQYLVSVSNDSTAKIWDWRSGSVLETLDFPGSANSVTFSPDGGTLAVGGVEAWPDAAIWTFAVPSWQPGMKLAEFWNIPAIVYTPDGEYLVGGGISRNSRIWRTSDGVDLFTLYHSGQVLDLGMSPDGTTVASGLCAESGDGGNCNQGAVWVWEVETGRLLQKLEDLPDWVEQVAYSLDGSVLIAGTRNGMLYFYTTADYQLISTISPPDGNGLFDLSPDGKILATTGRDGQIHLWRHEP